jgi:hypothetical protein
VSLFLIRVFGVYVMRVFVSCDVVVAMSSVKSPCDLRLICLIVQLVSLSRPTDKCFIRSRLLLRATCPENATLFYLITLIIVEDSNQCNSSLYTEISSGMLRHVALVGTDFSEELIASFIMVTRIGELGTTLALTINRCTMRRSTMYQIPNTKTFYFFTACVGC